MRDLVCRAAVVVALLAVAPGPAHAHDGGPAGTNTGDLSFFDPAQAGISYEWTLRMSRRQSVDLVHAVGAKSWHEPSNPEGERGWTHTTNWIAFELDEPTRVKITVRRQQGVVVTAGASAAVARFALVPALSLYAGWDDTTETESHTFNNVGNFWSTIVYLGSAANPKARSKVAYKAKLQPGKYSIVIGGNPRSLGEPSDYPAADCDPDDAVCYAYTGLQGYRTTIRTK